MELKKSLQFLSILSAIYWVLAIMVFCVAFDRFTQVIPNTFINIYWLTVICAFLLIGLFVFVEYKQGLKGKKNMIVSLLSLYTTYGFLLRQLVKREFKVKYKRSVLGAAWSFLNPLLIMGIQYIVFSTLFQSSTPNYPVYLLSGIVFFNLFNEATSSGMTSITGNASLLKKVYMPKYIYPLSKLISSLINFSISLIPLVIIMLITRTPLTWSLLLLIFDIIFLLIFTFGIILILSTLMTFFQDMQFLWGVIVLAWNYLTPIFYTDNIIPERFIKLYHINPLYQYLNFARMCIIDGVSPAASSYVWCVLCAIVSLFLGVIIFKKNEDKFVLHL